MTRLMAAIDPIPVRSEGRTRRASSRLFA